MSGLIVVKMSGFQPDIFCPDIWSDILYPAGYQIQYPVFSGQVPWPDIRYIPTPYLDGGSVLNGFSDTDSNYYSLGIQTRTMVT